MKKLFSTFSVFLILGFIFLWNFFLQGCSNSDRLAGTTTETTNGITGIAVNLSNQPLVNARVELRPTDYVAFNSNVGQEKKIQNVNTLTNGSFKLDSLPTGTYTVRLIAKDSSLVGLASTITISKTTTSILDLGLVKLSRPTTLTGQWMPQVNKINSDTLYLAVMGLESKIILQNSDKFILPTLPHGHLTFFARSSSGWENRWEQNIDSLADTVKVDPAQLNQNFLFDGTHSYFINTSIYGAKVLSSITNMPFPIFVSKTLKNNPQNGFRFWENNSGIWLNYAFDQNSDLLEPSNEIAWLQAGNHLNTFAKGNEITLYYGINTISTQNSQPVFSNQQGYGPIWHFSDLQNGKLQDYSNNGMNGFVINNSVIPQKGKVGESAEFSTADAKITLSTPSDIFFGKKNVSCAFWVKPTVSKGNIIYFGHSDSLTTLPLLSYSLNSEGKLQTYFNPTAVPNDSSYFYKSSHAILNNAWTHIATVFSLENHQMQIFINGEVDTTYTLPSALTSFSNQLISAGTIGGVNMGQAFNGQLDEMMFYFGAWSPDQIKYLFYTQSVIAE